jgi:hypothetical protein
VASEGAQQSIENAADFSPSWMTGTLGPYVEFNGFSNTETRFSSVRSRNLNSGDIGNA